MNTQETISNCSTGESYDVFPLMFSCQYVSIRSVTFEPMDKLAFERLLSITMNLTNYKNKIIKSF